MSATATESLVRLRIDVRGAVQGVGFRPTVYALAVRLGLTGWVNNNAQGVRIEVEGSREAVETFLLRLEPERPPHASIQSLEPTFLDPLGLVGFEIRPSEAGGAPSALVLPDLALCADCLRELFDPTDRRYRYPFLNCTHCGPRFSILRELPYDRANTSMARFPLCPRCRAEYDDPTDRRFHAQPNACPHCGPRLAWWAPDGRPLACDEAALQAAVRALREGALVAVKGLGGFHLLANAQDEAAVRHLRARKHREEKPFALMAPSLAEIARHASVSPLEARLLTASEAPIVLLSRRPDSPLAPSVAPGNPCLGFLLPYTPLHHLLLSDLGLTVVATSGNRSDEPLCIDEQEAVVRLRGIADYLLVHDRPIVRAIDDSVARVVLGREMLLRRARGYAPLPLALTAGEESAGATLAVGAHLKNTVALGLGGQAFLSQHLGDLETPEAYQAFEGAIADLTRLHGVSPDRVVCDLHPDYLSTRYAERTGLPLVRVQHHVAHGLACMAENGLEGSVLAVVWDGTGYGEDGTIWGGEFLRIEGHGAMRVAHLRPFRLPGGDRAVREPRRTACALLYALFGEAAFEREDLAPVRAFTREERGVVGAMLRRGFQAPQTSSMGRLFDAVAALLDVRQESRYEGQAAVELEALAADEPTARAYPIAVGNPESGTAVLDWEPLVREILADLAGGVPTGAMAARFHNALIDALLQVAHGVGVEAVVLTGGCFLNRRLLEGAVQRLTAEGFRPYWHQRVPPGDGGIALGQLAAAARWPLDPGERRSD